MHRSMGRHLTHPPEFLKRKVKYAKWKPVHVVCIDSVIEMLNEEYIRGVQF